jgi:hypothetical protein
VIFEMYARSRRVNVFNQLVITTRRQTQGWAQPGRVPPMGG